MSVLHHRAADREAGGWVGEQDGQLEFEHHLVVVEPLNDRMWSPSGIDATSVSTDAESTGRASSGPAPRPGEGVVFPTWLTLAAGDANVWHEATLTARPDDYSEGSRLFLQGVAGTTAIDVSRAMIARHQLLVDNLAAMDGVDVLIMPVSAVTAPPIPEIDANAVLSDGRPIAGDNVGPRFMMPYNVTGQPAMTVPVAIASDGLPLAVQVIGRPFGEVDVLRAATLLAESSSVDLRPPDFR